MRPTKQTYTLKEKKQLTHNTFELVFQGKDEISLLPGQFITFLLPKLGARAYSILKKKGENLHFIIGKIELENGGKGGSIYLCELEIGAEIQGIGASGIFVLQKTEKNKLFLGTGTGFVPLYNMIESSLENNYTSRLHFVFGVRTFADMFYLEKLEYLAKEYNNFTFEIYLSREEKDGFKNGYITEYISENTKNNFEETYICGSPAMVDDAKKKLLENGFNKSGIFEEKY